jgi:hypothetical protein
MDESVADCGIPNTCARVVPMWLVLLDNIPTFLMFSLGTILLLYICWPIAVVYCVYSIASIPLFWLFICPYCHHFGTMACPCGYGKLSAKVGPSKAGKGGKTFADVFKYNI